MRLVRIGVAAVSVKVGDFKGNRERLKAVVQEARAKDVHLLVTPELAISGYSLEDRIFWPDITLHSWKTLHELAKSCEGIAAFFGLPVRIGPLIYNASALIYDGYVQGFVLKKFLPTYSIFYEGRNWAAWTSGVTEISGIPAGDLVFKLPFGMVSAEICEDLWSAESPAYQRVLAGAEIICNGSASPFTPLRNRLRRRLVQGAAGNLACVYAYSNLLGCDNSRLVFDGGGFIATPDEVVAQGPLLSKEPWTLTTAVVDLEDVSRIRSENTTWRQQAGRPDCAEKVTVIRVNGAYKPAPVEDFAKQLPKSFFMPDTALPEPNPQTAYLDELFDGLVLGLRDYFEKVGAFDRFLVALSGGRDSALCLLIAVHAAKALKGGAEADRFAERVSAAYLPNTAISSGATEAAARGLAEELGVPFQVVTMQEEADIAREKAAELLGGAEHVTSLAKQNLQARVRGAMMLNWANSARGLVLVTSNLSEAAVGYTTTGGDNQGGYSPIANVPKTLISRLLARLHERFRLKS
ncbi:MAG: NAD(+) synthase, partial [FCB group bacterium]|nr:NAD(+) synthase [FCB group bacterium]